VVVGTGLLHAAEKVRGASHSHLALMPVLENNPVLAAYGAVRTGCTQPVSASGGGSGGSGESSGSGPQSAAAAAAAAAVAAGVLEATVAPAVSGGDVMTAPAQQQMAAGAPTGTAAAGAELAPAELAPVVPWEASDPGRAEAAAKVLRHLEGQRTPNRYGYLPIAQEWDIW